MEARMFDSPAAASEVLRSSTSYFCAACKRQHDGHAFGSVGPSLTYCQPAITSLVALGVIVKTSASSAGPAEYTLRRQTD
jgi:hypothetical protein